MTLKYDFGESMPHIKSVKCHTQTVIHVNNLASKERISKQHEFLHKQPKEAAIYCASTAYSGYKFGLSYKFYEHCVGDLLIWR